MHHEFAANAVDAVVANVCATDSGWVFTCPLHEVQDCSKSVVHKLFSMTRVQKAVPVCPGQFLCKV